MSMVMFRGAFWNIDEDKKDIIMDFLDKHGPRIGLCDTTEYYEEEEDCSELSD